MRHLRPLSPEGSALAAALEDAGVALDGAAVALAVVRGGALHFVTDPVVLDDRWWRLAGAAAETGAVAQDQEAGRARAVTPVPAAGPADPVPSALLLADRDGPGFDPAEVAVLRLLARHLQQATAAAATHGRVIELLGEYVGGTVASEILSRGDGLPLGGQTRDISVLFADLKGFTGLAERLDPDAVVQLLNRYFARAVPAITGHGGTLSSFIGDAVMGIFGAPGEQLEHPLAAARAGLDLVQAIEEVADGPDAPRFRVGIASGPATVGNVGSARRRVYTAIGDTVNLAARLEASAGVGEVVISADTHATIRGVAVADPLPPLTLKGKSQPVQAWVLRGLRETLDAVVGHRTVPIPVELLRMGL